MKRRHAMPFGARLCDAGGALFRLWAPDARRVDLVRSAGPEIDELEMHALPEGWYELAVGRADTSTRYAYRIDAGQVVPDPASRRNPDDVHGASALTDPTAFDWPDDGWRGRPWHEAVIYELHVGCFTPEGTFTAAIERLDDLVELGVTAIELMPVADFPGRRGWGYDGVLLYAPQASYGAPDDLKRLVAAAHARGLMVLLDVVYNHFGPEGNYLHAYARAFFDERVQTPWGAAVNFDGANSRTVRDFFIHNALYWIEEFHLDGLRIDAVHAMHDRSKPHFVDELARAVRAGPGRERQVHLILENDVNDAERLTRHADGTPAHADAQWNDDVHHALHALTTDEADGYYVDFAVEPLRLFGRALAEGFAYQGDASVYRHGEPRGTPSTHLPPSCFVDSIQTHDQVGNRAFGERIGMLAAARGRDELLRALVACVLLAPATPMLFMGEEYAADTPFLFFCDFEGDLARAVTEGRRNEFRRFARFADPAQRDRIPDPNAEATFTRSRLDWREREQPRHAAWLALYRELLRLRHEHLVPRLDKARSGTLTLPADGCIQIAWPLGDAGRWHLQANLSPIASTALEHLPGQAIYSSHPLERALPPWSMRVHLESA